MNRYRLYIQPTGTPQVIRENAKASLILFHLFANADEEGMVCINLSKVCKQCGTADSTAHKIIKKLMELHVIGKIVKKEVEMVTFCDSDDCEELAMAPQKENGKKAVFSTEAEKEKEKAERKEAKERINKKEKGEQQEQPLARENLSASSLKPSDGPPDWAVNYRRTLVVHGTKDERRARLWEKIQKSAHLFPEWTSELSKKFFLEWTQTTVDEKFYKFEVLHPSIPKAMAGYLCNHNHFEEYHQARLAVIGGGAKKQAQAQRQQQLQEQARAIAEEDHNERERRWNEANQKAVTREEALRDPAYLAGFKGEQGSA